MEVRSWILALCIVVPACHRDEVIDPFPDVPVDTAGEFTDATVETGPDVGPDGGWCDLDACHCTYPLVARCVSDRCICVCDPTPCDRYCHSYAERNGGCDEDNQCVCWGCPFGFCGDDAGGAGDTDASGCTRELGCPGGMVCDVRSCDPAATGSCVPVADTCEPTWNPVCGCDGVTYRNLCELVRADAGLDAGGYCTGTPCDGTPGSCPPGQLCNRNTGCTGVPGGTCVTDPGACPDTWAPSCGCDGVTYWNDCQRLRAGVGSEYVRACFGTGEACGIEGAAECPAGQACFRIGCAPATAGWCSGMPAECPDVLEPSCGCNGTVYDNDCLRLAAGVARGSPEICAGTECVPECRTDARGISFWMYPCTDEYLCEAPCTGCTTMCAAGRGVSALCPDYRTDAGCGPDNLIDDYGGGC